jgi:hypothetical protein
MPLGEADGIFVTGAVLGLVDGTLLVEVDGIFGTGAGLGLVVDGTLRGEADGILVTGAVLELGDRTLLGETNGIFRTGVVFGLLDGRNYFGYGYYSIRDDYTLQNKNKSTPIISIISYGCFHTTISIYFLIVIFRIAII